jgi:hypothetical protein
MNNRILGLLMLGIAAGPITTNAQTTTLDYQGYVMGGTSTTPPPGSPPSLIDIGSLTPISTMATFNAELTLSGSPAQNNLAIVSYDINVNTNNGNRFAFVNLGGGLPTAPIVGGASCSSLTYETIGCIRLTASGNTLSGANFNLQTDWAKAPNFQLNIGPGGDAFGYHVAAGNCRAATGVYTITYVGAAANSPCTVNVSNSTAGAWRAESAPEMDPASAASGLTLLLGCLLVLRGRRAGDSKSATPT